MISHQHTDRLQGKPLHNEKCPQSLSAACHTFFLESTVDRCKPQLQPGDISSASNYISCSLLRNKHIQQEGVHRYTQAKQIPHKMSLNSRKEAEPP